VIDFWEAVGPDNIRNYMHNLVKKSASILVDKWKSRVLAPRDMFGSMCAIQLPNALYACCDDIDYSHAEAVQNLLFHRYNIEVPIKEVQGELYVRISAHIYNELEEYEKLGDAILELTEENALASPISL
jgi:selenocysteine lyase/cysteine desulfurase